MREWCSGKRIVSGVGVGVGVGTGVGVEIGVGFGSRSWCVSRNWCESGVEAHILHALKNIPSQHYVLLT